jgi:hypothetical protein
MKVTQTADQIELDSSGFGQLLLGVILIIAGVLVAIFMHGSTGDDGKQAPIWVTLIGVGIAIGGLLSIIFARNRSVVVQRGGNATVRTKRLIGGGTQEQSVPAASIVAVRLSTYLQNTGSDNNTVGNDPANSRRSVLYLVLNNNDLVQVGSSGSSNGFSMNGLNIGGLISKAPLSKEAGQLSEFLGVPLQADDTSSIAGAVRSLKSAFQQGQAPAQPAQPVQPAQPPAQTPPLNPGAPQPAAAAPPPPAPPLPTPAQQPPSAPAPPVPTPGQETGNSSQTPPPYSPPGTPGA